MPKLPTNRHITVSPVAAVCATVCFLAVLALFGYLVSYQPIAADAYLRPIIQALVTLGGVALLWWRQARSQVQHSAENAVIIEKADDAATKAEEVKEVVEHKLNGDLDARIQHLIENAVLKLKDELTKGT